MLRQIFLSLILVMLSITCAAAQSLSDNVSTEAQNFIVDLITQAQERDTQILMIFSKPNCGYCRRLKNEVIADPNVQRVISKLVVKEIDMHQEPGNELSKLLRAYSSPVTILFDKAGNEVDRIVGYYPVDEFLPTLQNYIAGVETLGDYLARYQANPNDPEVLYNLEEKYCARYSFREAFGLVRDLVELDPENKSDWVDDALYLQGSYEQRKMNQAENAVKTFIRVLENYPQSDKAVSAYNRLLLCYSELKQPENMIIVYEKYMDDIPPDARAYRVTATELVKFPDNPANLEIAFRSANHAITLDPAEPRGYSILSTVNDAMGNVDLAIANLEKALEMDPENQQYKLRLDRIKAEKQQ